MFDEREHSRGRNYTVIAQKKDRLKLISNQRSKTNVGTIQDVSSNDDDDDETERNTMIDLYTQKEGGTKDTMTGVKS